MGGSVCVGGQSEDGCMSSTYGSSADLRGLYTPPCPLISSQWWASSISLREEKNPPLPSLISPPNCLSPRRGGLFSLIQQVPFEVVLNGTHFTHREYCLTTGQNMRDITPPHPPPLPPPPSPPPLPAPPTPRLSPSL